MAVMNNMREYTKVILIILVLAFIGTIIFDWGMDVTGMKTRSDIVGKVEGIEISTQQFNEVYSNQIDNYRQQTGREPSENQLQSIRNQTWESLVQDILIRQAVQAKDITAHDQEILYRIKNDPPEFLRSNPSFQNEQKQFDMAKYQAALNDPRTASQWRPVEEYIRQTLPREKFFQRLRATIRVTEDEIRREYLKQNQQATVKYVFFNPNNYADVEIELTDEELKSYYDNHKEEFQEEEKRKIDYVLFQTTPTASDSADQRDLAERLLQRAKSGEDFSELAEIYSEDTGTKQKGGDLGFFERGTMVQAFEEAAFNAEIGDIVGPVKSQFGLHIIKVEDKRERDGKEEVKARHILIKFQPSRKTTNKARDDAEYFAARAEETSFSKAAEEFDIEVSTSNLFPKGSGFVPGVGLNPQVSNFVFSNDVGDIGPVEETNRGFFVYRIADKQKAHTKPFEEVKSQIKNTLLAEKRSELATKHAQEIYDQIQQGASFEAVAERDTLEVKQPEPFTRGGYVPDVGQEPKFTGAAFALDNPGEVTLPVKATRGTYLIQLVQKDEFNEEDYLAKKEQIRNQLLQRKEGQVFASWYAEAKENAKIEDLRENYF